MRRIAALILALLSVSCCAAAETIYWEEGAAYGTCTQKRMGCELLQMVMMGNFASLDLADSLNVRVFSAVFPMLLDITQEDASHFCEEFDVSEEYLARAYYIAMGHCLRAVLLLEGTTGDAVRDAANLLLSLFLDPQPMSGGEKKVQAIRQQTDEEDIAGIAEAAQLPEGFVRYVMMSDDWRSIEP